VRSHEGWALSYAGAMLGSTDAAADAVQDAFVRAYRNLDGLEEGRPFAPWFRAILRNRCLDELRSARSRREVSREARREDGRRVRGARRPDAPERVEREELGRIVRSALGELSPEKRTALVLREMEEMSYEEIADQLGLSTGTVSSRLHHARQELRGVLEERGFTVEDATT
jgi:RNA polymerase sigma-70 factor (ECF subfamily)